MIYQSVCPSSGEYRSCLQQLVKDFASRVQHQLNPVLAIASRLKLLPKWVNKKYIVKYNIDYFFCALTHAKFESVESN